jgi:hypothetical protein
MRRAFSLAHLLQPGVYRRAGSQALQLGTQEFLHRLALQSCTGRQFVAHPLGNITDVDLNRHAFIMPAMSALCKRADQRQRAGGD